MTQGDIFLWIEVLSAAGTPRLKEFVTRVVDAWLAIKLKVRELTAAYTYLVTHLQLAFYHKWNATLAAYSQLVQKATVLGVFCSPFRVS